MEGVSGVGRVDWLFSGRKNCPGFLTTIFWFDGKNRWRARGSCEGGERTNERTNDVRKLFRLDNRN